MEAESSVELGCEDARLELPWRDPEGRLVYCNLREDLSAIDSLPELTALPALGAFLRALNAADSPFESAKCDVWTEEGLAAHEAFFEGDGKRCCYVDLLLNQTHAALRADFELHERLADAWAHALDEQTGEATAEMIVRRCVFHQLEPHEGYYWTLYLRGFGEGGEERQQRLEEALEKTLETLLRAETRKVLAEALEVRGFLR